jgi:5-formyltetrahydrofolate cyclo-ligase
VDASTQAAADARKAVLRREARARRRTRTAAQRADDAAGLVAVVLAAAPVAAARRVALYCSTPDEPGTGPVREALRARGVEVLLPVVDGDDLDWALDDGATVPGHRGVPAPSGPRLGLRALVTCDVALVPALAVDTAGRRLGQGGGHYDRALAAARPAGPVVALLHDGEVRDAARDPVPGLPHDARVDAVATPTRWLWTAGGSL